MNKDTEPTKEKIIEALKKRGPSLPVHISNEVGLSTLFASAFLGELLSSKEIKMSHMKVGSSPIYLIAGQEPKLENFAQHLKSREKDAYELLKENKFLEDNKQEPAIRVALRAIKDFAIAFTDEGKIVWRYFTTSESDYKKKEKEVEEPKKEIEPEEFEEQEESNKPIEEKFIGAGDNGSSDLGGHENEIKKSKQEPKQKELNIFDKKLEKPKKSAQKKKSASAKQNQKFFEKVKTFLSEKEIEILDIVGVSKDELILKINKNEEEHLLLAYNKRRVDESDIIKAYKKAQDFNLPYIILTKGDQTKKLNEFLKAAKFLNSIDKFE